jgi:hypothetical protein
MTNVTKATLRAELATLGVEVPAKANHAALTALLEQHTAPDAEPVTPPLPVAQKPTQVAVGLVIEKDRPTQNGVTRPSAGGRCRAVWDALDAYQRETKDVPTAKVVRELAADEGWNPNNASIEFYQWRKFNGITGRAKKVVAEVAPAPAATEAE